MSTPSVRAIILILLSLVFAGCAASAILKQAEESAARSEWDEAALKYSELIRMEPDNFDYKTKYMWAKFEAAQIHYSRGEEHLNNRSHDAAILEFQAALMLDPTLGKAQTAMKKAKKQMDSIYQYGRALEFLKDGREKDARAALKKALQLNPANEAAAIELDRLKKQQRATLDGYELNMKSMQPINLEFKDANVKKIFEVLSRLSGMNFVYDEDVRDTRTNISLKNATFQQALELILMTNKLARKVMSENTIIIYPATPQKSQQYEELMIRAFYLSNTDAKKTVNLLRTMLKAKDIQVHEELNAIVVRARPEAIELAQKILDATDLADAEVMLAVEIIEVDRNKVMNLGLDLAPDAVTAAAPLSNGVIKLQDLKNLSSGQMLIGLPSAILNLKKEDLDANVLANPRIRVRNNGKAKIHIGDRIPTITTTVNQGVSTESIQYQDVGLKLNVEPIVRPGDDIDLKIGLEVSSLGTKTTTNSGSVAYQIGTRNAETVLRLHDGETQVIGGLINDEERTTVARIPLLGDIPGIGRLFARTDSSKVKTDIMLAITPHIVRTVDMSEEAEQGFMSGKDEAPSTRSPLEGFRATPFEQASPAAAPGIQEAPPPVLPLQSPPELPLQPPQPFTPPQPAQQ